MHMSMLWETKPLRKTDKRRNHEKLLSDLRKEITLLFEMDRVTLLQNHFQWNSTRMITTLTPIPQQGVWHNECPLTTTAGHSRLSMIYRIGGGGGLDSHYIGQL